MKLEEGMYVRTPKGISKITSMYNEINQYIVYTDKDETFEYYLNEEGKWQADYVDKASYNILDLIDVGDYVNGELVQDITGEYIRIGNVSHNKSWLSNNIKAILTHEQYEKYCYKLGDDK